MRSPSGKIETAIHWKSLGDEFVSKF